MLVHLVDGTYELFRHFFGQPARPGADGSEIGAVRGVVWSVLSMLSEGATHVGVATDHVIESFRNDLWPGYKSSAGVAPELLAQFPLLETALNALGVVVWPMVELEADDALASAAATAADDGDVHQVIVCTPDKDLAQVVRGTRVVQLDRRKKTVTDEDGVVARFGVHPASIPDWLGLVGDTADGYPGLAGWGKQTASTVLARYEHLEAIPARAAAWDADIRRGVRGADKLAARLSTDLEHALLFRTLATLQVERGLVGAVADLGWRGPEPGFDEVCAYLRDPALAVKAAALAETR